MSTVEESCWRLALYILIGLGVPAKLNLELARVERHPNLIATMDTWDQNKVCFPSKKPELHAFGMIHEPSLALEVKVLGFNVVLEYGSVLEPHLSKQRCRNWLTTNKHSSTCEFLRLNPPHNTNNAIILRTTIFRH